MGFHFYITRGHGQPPSRDAVVEEEAATESIEDSLRDSIAGSGKTHYRIAKTARALGEKVTSGQLDRFMRGERTILLSTAAAVAAALGVELRLAGSPTSRIPKRAARQHVGAKVRFLVFRRDGYRCRLCGMTAEDGIKLHIDHIVPVANGGKTEESNLWTLCQPCNSGKGVCDLNQTSEDSNEVTYGV